MDDQDEARVKHGAQLEQNTAEICKKCGKSSVSISNFLFKNPFFLLFY